MTRVGRAVRAVRLACLMIVAGLVLAGCSTPRPALSQSTVDEAPAVSVVDQGWHTSIAVVAPAIAKSPLKPLVEAFPGARYLVFGFGDRVYFTAHEVTPLGTLRAMFPGPGIILVTGLNTTPGQAFGADQTIALPVTADQQVALIKALGQALQTSSAVGPVRLGDGPYPGSAFYATGMGYDLFHDCNRWTLVELRAAGVPVHPEGVIFAHQVMEQVEGVAKSFRGGGSTTLGAIYEEPTFR